MSDIEPDNLLYAIQPEVASHAGVPDKEISNADLLSLMQNYFCKTLLGIERNFADTTQDLAHILDNISGASDNLHHKRYSKAVSLLEESEKMLKKRNKLIRIADKSEAGWKTVDEYLSDEVASNSEDEKKIRTAETRAVKKMKVTKRSNRSEKKRPAEAAGGPSSFASGTGGVAAVSRPPFRVGGASGPNPRFVRSKARDIYFVVKAIQDLLDANLIREESNAPFVVNPLTVSVSQSDDGLALAEEEQVCAQQAIRVKQDLILSGFVPNKDKCIWRPVQNLVWLGFILDLKHCLFQLLPEKVANLVDLAGVVRTASQSIIREILFWRQNIVSLKPVAILRENWDFKVFTDASDGAGAGFVANSDYIMHKQWLQHKVIKSSTWRELKAVELSIDSFKHLLSNSSVSFFTDNQSAVGIIQKGSYVPELQTKYFLLDSGLKMKTWHILSFVCFYIVCQKTITDARAKSTVDKYSGGFKRFAKWTEKYREITCILPYKEIYVGLYLHNLIESANHFSIIEFAFYSIRWAHNLAGVKNPCYSDLISSIVESARRTLSRPIKTQEPVTSDIMIKLFAKYNTSNSTLKDLRLLTICSSAYTEQLKRRLEQWKVDDQQFVSTEAEKHVMQKVLTQSSVTLVGNSGTGKSFLSKHIALIMMMEHGYFVIPCRKPEDIEKWFKHDRKTLFVFDDVCGRYTLDQQIYNEWKHNLDHITSLFEDKCCKIMSTCRLEVYKDELFSNLSIFKMCNINLSSHEFKLSPAEKIALAEVYFKENADEVKELSEKYDFFPLLCSLYNKQNLQKKVSISSFFSNPFDVFKAQVVQMYGESDAGKMHYCSLVLCVIFNNTLTEEILASKDKKINVVIKVLLEECELNKGTSIKRLMKSLETLEGTYVVKADTTYKIIHDKLFDFLAKYFGEKMIHIFIDHANTEFIRERFLWKITDNMCTEIEFVIRIPDKYVNRYIERLVKDWESGFVYNVCHNRNMSTTIFTVNLVTHLNQLDASKQQELVCTKDFHSNDIALSGCCYIGTIDLVKWLIRRNSDINYCRQDGWFPLLLASQEGHVDVVNELLQHSADVNKCSNRGIYPLDIACYNNRIEVVRKLLQCDDIDIDLCDNDGCSSLYQASQKGHIDVVKELLQHSADVNKCNNNDASPLYIASHEGHADVVTELLQHSADVNKCRNNGTPPLQIACYNNRIEVVHELLQCKDIDIDCCDDAGCSSLYKASKKGHVDVVKELLQHSADYNKCNNRGTPPLQIACYNNRIEVVRILLQCKDIDIDRCDNAGCSSLYKASQKGHVDVVKELLQHSADVNKCNNNDASPLYRASHEGHVNVVTELLQHSADVNKCRNDGTPPLQIACYYNRIEVVRVLLQCDDIDIDLCDNDGCSSLYNASQKGHVDVVKELLQHSADVNKCKNNDASPLYIASQDGQVNVVKKLLQHSADVNKCRNDGTPPLQIACYNKRIEVVRVLLQCKDIDIDRCDDAGCSSLYKASQKGHVDVVKELLQHSADVNKCNNNDASPLYIASQEGHVDVVKELIQHSADINKCRNDGTPPLQIACYYNRIEVVRVLLQCDDIDIDLCDNDGCSSLYNASQKGHVDVVKELLQHSADVNKCKNNDASPLYIASQDGQVNVVKKLLQHSADVNKCRNDGTPPLQIACYNNRIEVVRVLLQCKDIDIDRCDDAGCSSLYKASQKGHVDVVKELLQHSADVNKCNNNDASPLYIASQEGHVDVVKELIQHSADINKCNNNDASPLYIASQDGHVNVVTELLQHSAHVNQCSNDDTSPLQIACYNNRIEVVRVLLQWDDIDIDRYDDAGFSSLYQASQKGHVDVVKELLQHSADVNKADVNKCNNNDASPLYIASQKGHVDVAKELIQHSADVNKCNNNDASPLYIASQEGYVDVVKELLQHSAHVNKCSNMGIYPLDIACYNNRIEVVRVLLQCKDIDIDLCDNDGCSSLYKASQKGHVDVVKELLQHSADVNKCNNNDASPLYIASQKGHVNVVTELLQHSADVNKCNNNDASPLYSASHKGHVNVVTELLQHSADVNKCRNDGTPPLQIACYYNRIEVVRVLLQCDDIDIDLCDNDGCSSLYKASQKGHVDVVKELLQHSADVNKCNNNDASPLYIASQDGQVNVVKTLLQHSADVNKCRNDGTPPLQIACYNNRIEVVRELLQCKDIDIDRCDDAGYSSLYKASQKGHFDVVKELLQHSADVNKCNNNDESPLL
ncbi:unnamed protein product [Mytilus coruscus]|uniref:Novel STAND NTPase 3 domain-containing protein n=1 Tax=Mytilus coruscus TaxID=42192 RepID=A0A6J8BGI5_MYTCO|nr:unnamed protein product [Mytilus coruscus]